MPQQKKQYEIFLLETLFLRLLYFWRRDRHFTWSSQRREGLAVQGKGSTFVSNLFSDPEYWSGRGNRTRKLPLCSQALYRANTAAEDESKIQLKECTALLHERLRLIKRSLGPDQLIIANLAYFQDKDIIKCFLNYVYVSKGAKYEIFDDFPNEVDDWERNSARYSRAREKEEAFNVERLIINDALYRGSETQNFPHCTDT